MMSRLQVPIAERPTSHLNLALDLALHVSASRKQMDLYAQVRDNVSNAFLASVKLPACANLATCMLDVKAGYCGVCYQSLPSAVVAKVSEECIEFCKRLGPTSLYSCFHHGRADAPFTGGRFCEGRDCVCVHYSTCQRQSGVLKLQQIPHQARKSTVPMHKKNLSLSVGRGSQAGHSRGCFSP